MPVAPGTVSRGERLRAVAIGQNMASGLRWRDDVPDWSAFLLNHPFIPTDALSDYSAAFRKVEIVSSCIDALAGDIAGLPIRVWKGRGPGREEIEPKRGNLAWLLEHPNALKTGFELRYENIASLLTWGNSYWKEVSLQGDLGPISELWELPAPNFEVIPTSIRGVLSYRYRASGYGAPDDLRPETVHHFRDYNPDDEPIGAARLESTRQQYEAAYYAYTWLLKFFRGGGMLSGIFTTKDGAQRLAPSAIQEMQKALVDNHIGIDKAWWPIILQGLEFIRQGMTLAEMDLERHMALINAGICRRIGVPPNRVAISRDASQVSVAKEDNKNYWFSEIPKLTKRRDAVINQRIAPRYGPDIYVETDISGVLTVQEAQLDLVKTMVIAAGRPTHKVNEMRMMRGDPAATESDGVTPDDSANELYLPGPVGVAPQDVNADTGSDSGDQPSGDRAVEKATPASPVERKVRKSASQRTSRLAMLSRARPGTQQREAIKRAQDMNLARYERRVARLMEQHFRQQQALSLALVRMHGGAFGQTALQQVRAEDLIPPTDPDVQRRFEDLVRQLVLDRGEEALADLAGLSALAEQATFDVNAERAADFIAQKTGVFAKLDETTSNDLRDRISQTIATARDRGEVGGASLSEIIATIRETYGARINNAMTIARTETVGAYNFATHEAWSQSGIHVRQEWMTARDGQGKRHAVPGLYPGLDGQVRELDESFDVGGIAVRFPGDPEAPPDQKCNCRCVISPVVDDEPGMTMEQSVDEFFSGALVPPSRNGSAHRLRRELSEAL